MSIFNPSIQVKNPKKVAWPKANTNGRTLIANCCGIDTKKMEPSNLFVDLPQRNGSVERVCAITGENNVTIQLRSKADNIRFVHNINIGFEEHYYGIKCFMDQTGMEELTKH